jgi:hypothetical protein
LNTTATIPAGNTTVAQTIIPMGIRGIDTGNRNGSSDVGAGI